MKPLKYILILLSLLVASCTADDIITIEGNGKHNGDQIQLAARFLPFSEYDVKSRTADDVTYDFVIFGTKPENNNELVCVYYKHSENEVVGVDRNSDFKNININNNWLANCYVYVLANYTAIYEHITTLAGGENVSDYIKTNIVGKVGTDFFTGIAQPVAENVNLSEDALPRYGQYSSTVNFSEGAQIASGTMYTVNMQSLYAKMVFTVRVSDPTQPTPSDIPGANTFELHGYTVTNLPTTVDMISGTENTTHDQVSVHVAPIDGALSVTDKNNLTFTCYIPERFFRPGAVLSADNFVYPFGTGSNIRPEDEHLRQRYKPLLAKGLSSYEGDYVAANDRKATYVTISGVFKNHQGHSYNVSYDVYVGNDHYSNFDIVRNRQYNNILTIRGIDNSADQVYGQGTIVVDHRVNVSRTRPVIINLRRETLLDAHFEVRPLRIRRNWSHTGEETNHVKVDVIYDNNVSYPNGIGNWIGLERSYGVTDYTKSDAVENSPNANLYCPSTSGSSGGKRKYFTYDLVNKSFSKGISSGTDDLMPLHTSTSVVVPIPSDQLNESENECVWIYVDECTEASPALDANRSATIRITCGNYDGETFTPIGDPLDYVIRQHKLFEIDCEGRKYHIEHEEEYLHNFDSEDNYEDNQTKEEGIPWGLNGEQLSYIHDSFICEEENSDWKSFIQKNPIKYDFYIGKHDDDNDNSDVKTTDGGTLHNYAGQEFTKEIAENPNAGIGELTLAETANSAVEYCYNRNKRDRNGNVVEVEWYLPSADELEDFIVPAYSTFKEFQDNYYWTSQPAYIRNAFYYEYFNGGQSDRNREDTYVFVVYEDNKTHARATKVAYTDGKYDYVPSGLNRTSENATIDCNNPICKDTYFNVMYGWYRWRSWGSTQTTEKIGDNAMKTDEHFNEYIDGDATGIRYHVELGHLDDLIQKTSDDETGYKKRTESHRVRCVRVVPRN